MPNWVRNKLVIKGDNYQDVIDKITTYNKNEDCLEFDFNKIVPMPNEIKDIVAGSITTQSMEIFINAIKYRPEFLKYVAVIIANKGHYTTLTDEEYTKEVKELLEMNDIAGTPYFNDEKDIIAYGKRAFDNQIKYGAIDWYEWSIRNWGVKWNASLTEIKDNEITFETPWDNVAPLMERLSLSFPNNSFEYSYSEEQLCVYCGKMKIENGTTMDREIYKPESREAFELGFEFWPDAKRHFKLDKKANTYKFVEEEME